MTKKIRKIINISFLIVFLLGYIGTIIPSNTVASLFDLKVYALDEEPEEEEITTTTIYNVSLENENITSSINSNQSLPSSWLSDSSYLTDEYYPAEVTWYDDNDEFIDSNSSLENSLFLYGHIKLNSDTEINYPNIYVFDENITTEEVTFNGVPVDSVRVYESPDLPDFTGYTTGMEVVIKVNVIHTGGPNVVNTLKVGSATLDYVAGDEPEYSASTLESNKYIVPAEVFVDSNQNPVVTFEAGNTYQYRVTIRPQENFSIANASTIILNGTAYDLIYEGANQNATVVGDDVIFYGYSVTIPEAQTPSTIEVTVNGYTGYGSGIFEFQDGVCRVNINGNDFTGVLTNGKIIINGNQANISVHAWGTGYLPTITINGNQVEDNETIQITQNSTINVTFTKVYSLTFSTNGGSSIPTLENQPAGTTINLNNYTPVKQNYKFDGWYESNSLIGNPIKEITLNSNKTVYAKWTPITGSIAITHNHASGITGIKLNNVTVVGDTETGYIDNTNSNILTIEVQDNYKINSVTVTDANSIEYPGGPGAAGEDITIQVAGSTSYNIQVNTEEVVETTYTLTYNTGCDIHYDPETNLVAGSTFQIEARPDRGGYRFDGWYDNSDFNGSPITSILMNSDKTIYAKWTQLEGTITVTYNSPQGLEAVSINNSTLQASGNTVTGYITSDNNNTIRISPTFAEGYQVTSVVVTDANGNKTRSNGGEVNAEVEMQVAGSTSYAIAITIVKPEPQQLYTVQFNLTGLRHSGEIFETNGENDYTTTLSLIPDMEPGAGTLRDRLPVSVQVKVGDLLLLDDNFSYNDQTGVLTIPALVINGNITITAHSLGVVQKPAASVTEFTYEARDIGLETGFDGRTMEKSGTDVAMNVGNYSVTYTLNNPYYIWNDDTSEPVVINWAINKANINPTVTMEGWTVGENPHNPVINGNLGDAAYIIEYKDKNAPDSAYIETKPTGYGEYTVRVTIEESPNYNSGVATCDFTIFAEPNEPIKVDLPTLYQKKYVYTGDEITVDDGYNNMFIERSGESATDIGTYQVRYSLRENEYVWDDNTREDKVLTWTIVPETPVLSATYTYNSITLKWNAAKGATGYQLRECNSEGGSCKLLYNGTATSYTHSKLTYYSTHYYKLIAYGKDENNKSVYSDYTDLKKVVARLATPVVKASTNRYQEVRVKWGKINGAEKYYVYRCDDEGAGCSSLGTSTTTNYVDKTGRKNVTYTYKVKAYRAKKYSALSNPVVGIRLNDNLAVGIANREFQKVKIAVKYKENVKKYEIYKSTDNKKWTLLKTVEPADNNDHIDELFTVYDKKAKFNKKVYYRVRAYNGVNWTAYVTKSLTASFLGVPEVYASTERYQEVRLSWDAVKGAEKYYIYKCNSAGANCKELANTTATEYANKKAAEGKNSYYKVRTYRAKKYSGYSSLVTGFRVNDDLDVTVKNTDYLVNTITIQLRPDASRYQIQKSEDNKKWTTLSNEYAYNYSTEIVLTDKNVKYNKKYYYRVRAYNDINWTAFATFNVTTTRLKAPVVDTAGTVYHPTLTVTKVPQATGYEFYHWDSNTQKYERVQKGTSLKFTKSYDSELTHKYRVRAYKTINKKDYVGNWTDITIDNFK